MTSATKAAPLFTAALTCTITATFPDGVTTHFEIVGDPNRSVGGAFASFTVLPIGGPDQNVLKLVFDLDVGTPANERITFPAMNAITESDPSVVDLDPLVTGIVPIVNDTVNENVLIIYVPLNNSTQSMGSTPVVIDVSCLIMRLSGHPGLARAWRR